jgi:hypothetical protein
MGPNTTVQQFVEMLNELNRYLLSFPEECLISLTQDEIIEILNQAKPPNWHEAMLSANIDILKWITNRQFHILDNGPAPTIAVDYNTSITSCVGVGVGVGVNRGKQKTIMWRHCCDKTNHKMAKCQDIPKVKQHKRPITGQRLFPKKKDSFFHFEEINALEKQLKPAKAEKSKTRKAESLLSPENNLTNSDKMEEYFFYFPLLSVDLVETS